MKISILTEANEKIGLGHLIRCSAIYEGFLNISSNVELIVQSNKSIKLFNKIKYTKKNWLSKDFKIITDIILVDSYSLTKDIWNNLEKQIKLFVYIDDGNIPIYSKNAVLLKFAIEAKPNGINKQLFGIKYFPIRQNIKNRSEIKSNNIIVMFGGTDIRELSTKFIPIYEKYSKFTFNIVTANKSIFKKIEQKNNIIPILNPNWDYLAELISSSYLAISSGGTILYELSYLAIPTIAIKVIDNQEKGINEFVKKGFICQYLNYDDKNLVKHVENLLNNYINNYEFYKEKAKLGKLLIDGHGADRISRDIIKLYKEKS